MPSNNDSPLLGIMAEVDARDWTGVAAFNRGGGNSVLATTDFFPDATDFLNGRGVPLAWTLTTDLAGTWAAGGTMTVGIDANDRFYIECADPGAVNFEIDPGAGNAAFGFSTTGAGPAVGGPPYRLTATSEWQRGVVEQQHMVVNPVGAAPPASSTLPSIPYRVPCLTHLVRGRSNIADLDDVHDTDTLEMVDNAINDAGQNRIRWGLDDDGHVWHAWPTVVAPGDIAWNAAGSALRDFLGFTGSEASVAVATGGAGELKVVTATYPCSGVLYPTRPRIDLTRRVEQVTNTQRLTSGEVAQNVVGTYSGWSLRFFLDGPADSVDHHRHYVGHVLPYMAPGQRATLYPNRGDTRRSLETRGVNDDQVAYDALYTSEANGYEGRLRCRRDPSDPGARQIQWGGQRGLRRRIEQQLLLTDFV